MSLIFIQSKIHIKGRISTFAGIFVDHPCLHFTFCFCLKQTQLFSSFKHTALCIGEQFIKVSALCSYLIPDE